MPKSTTFTTPALLIRMFAGLTSRWMRPCRWLNFNASQTSAIAAIARREVMAPRAATTSRSVWPSTYSITM